MTEEQIAKQVALKEILSEILVLILLSASPGKSNEEIRRKALTVVQKIEEL